MLLDRSELYTKWEEDREKRRLQEEKEKAEAKAEGREAKEEVKRVKAIMPIVVKSASPDETENQVESGTSKERTVSRMTVKSPH